MAKLALLIQALASIGWVGFAFAVLFLFRQELSAAVKRVTKAQILGQTLELSDDLNKLASSAAETIKEIEAFPPQESRATDPKQQLELDDTIHSVLKQAATAPKLALMALWVELERRARRALATRGGTWGPIHSYTRRSSERTTPLRISA